MKKKTWVTKIIFTLLIQAISVLGIAGEGSDGNNGRRTYSVTFQMPDPEAEARQRQEAEAKKALQDPEAYNRNTKDIGVVNELKVMTAEMAKFYMVVAGLEYAKCFYNNDSTLCNQFIQSLKDPASHVGFAIFMKANRMTVELAQISALKGRISPGMAGYLGLATGMMAQGIFTDIYYHPTVRAYFSAMKISDPVERKKAKKDAKNAMWKAFTQGSGKYLFDKIPHVGGLLGAAFLSHQTTKMIYKGYDMSKTGVVKLSQAASRSGFVVKYGSKFGRVANASRMVIKFGFKATRGLRVQPVIALGSYALETTVFLLWAPVVEDFLVKHWDRSFAIKKLAKTKKALEDHLIYDGSVEKAKKLLKKHQEARDEYRGTLLHSANITKMTYLNDIYKMSEEISKINLYYGWMLDGMDYDSQGFLDNLMNFREEGMIQYINQSTAMAKAFFCGPSAHNSVFRTLDKHGIPMPGSYSFDFIEPDSLDTHFSLMEKNRPNSTHPTGIVVSPFRIKSYEGLCTWDIKNLDGSELNEWTTGNYDDVMCPVDYDFTNREAIYKPTKTKKLFCKLYQEHVRAHVFRSGFYKGRYVTEELADEATDKIARVYRKINTQRDLVILRYEKKLRQQIVSALTGRSVDIEDDETVRISGPVGTAYSGSFGDYSLGVIPSYDNEIIYFSNLKYRTKVMDPKIREMLEDAVQKGIFKKKAAQELLQYNLTSYEHRVRRSSANLMMHEQEDWEKVVDMLRSFVIN